MSRHLVLGIVLAFVGLVSATSEAEIHPRNVCFRDCANCSLRCRADAVCKRTCIQVKQLCCRTIDNNPGSNLTCNCG